MFLHATHNKLGVLNQKFGVHMQENVALMRIPTNLMKREFLRPPVGENGNDC